jgi:hypothetical protein
MDIKRYKKFLEDKENDFNYREDEHSHLNDELNSRWDDSTYDPYDDNDYYNDPGYRKLHSSSFRDEEYEDDDVEQDDMQHLLYLLRTMFKNSGVDNVRIDNDRGLDILIYCTLERKERLKDVIRVFEVVNKLKKDILAQYDTEYDVWQNRKGQPMFVFSFEYNEGLDDDNMPF